MGDPFDKDRHIRSRPSDIHHQGVFCFRPEGRSAHDAGGGTGQNCLGRIFNGRIKIHVAAVCFEKAQGQFQASGFQRLLNGMVKFFVQRVDGCI